MKNKLTLLFLCLLSYVASNATTYYISVSGNDANNGTSASTPWKTLSKLNSLFSSLKAGDNVLFNRGDVFYGKIIVNSNGTAGSLITIGAYGTGANPVITGFTSIASWTNKGSNIWESTSAVSGLPTCNMVAINGVNTAMGRTPNYPDYYTWNSHSGSSSISTGLSGTTNWTGAELAIFTTSYKNARHPIIAQSGGTISFTSGGDLWQNAPGYFLQQFHIQNDIRTLDTLNEWYYNPSTKRLDIYSTSSPTGVQMATLDTLIWTNNKSYITIRDLALTGANKDAISIATSKNLKIINCNISYIGGTAIYGITCCSNMAGLRIDSNTIKEVNNSGIDLKYWYVGDTIRYNTIKNVNMLIGMQDVTHTISGGVAGIGNESDSGVISYNNLDSIGTGGISYKGSYAIIDHNFVNHSCYGTGIKDLGAIYTWNGLYKTVVGTKVSYNIVLNTGLYSKGFMFDEGSNGIEVNNNTAYNTLRGVYINDSYNINIHDNTTFNTSISGGGAGLFMNNNNSGPKLTNITVKNNKFIAKTPDDRALWVTTSGTTTMPLPFSSDSNYFARPLGDSVNNIQTYIQGGAYVQRTLASWQALNGQDAHSRQSPRIITDINDFNFQYNATSSPVTISLPYSYLDITGATYNGSITLQPYTSAVLIKNAALLPAVNPGTTVNGLNYSYYQTTGGYSVVPNFSLVTPIKSDTVSTFDISPANRSTVFSFNFNGYVKVPADGQYTFYTSSDDGSNLYIDNVLVVNNDGLHAAIEKSGNIGLKAGLHAISVGYFQQGGRYSLSVSYSGSGISKQSIPASALYIVSGGNLLTQPVSLSQNSIDLSNQFELKAYPNPFINSIILHINGNAGDYKLMLVDAVGKTIWTRVGTKTQGAFDQSVNTSSLQRGVYFFKLIQDNNTSTIKLLKE